MTPNNELRLLPWLSPEGKPCYLSTDDTNSLLSRLADTAEAIQLDRAAELVAHATDLVSDRGTESEALRAMVTHLVGALRDLLRLAESRGHRLYLRAPFETER